MIHKSELNRMKKSVSRVIERIFAPNKNIPSYHIVGIATTAEAEAMPKPPGVF